MRLIYPVILLPMFAMRFLFQRCCIVVIHVFKIFVNQGSFIQTKFHPCLFVYIYSNICDTSILFLVVLEPFRDQIIFPQEEITFIWKQNH